MRFRFSMAVLSALALMGATRASVAQVPRPAPGTPDGEAVPPAADAPPEPDIGAAERSSVIEPKRILFVLGAGDAQAADATSLRAAVQAQLAGYETEVVFIEFDGKPKSLRAQVDAARALLERNRAMGTFWIDVADDGSWLLYLAEGDAGRVLVRRIEVQNAAAGTEVVAVITSSSASALASGRTVRMEEVSEEEIESLDRGEEVSPFKPLPDLAPRRPPPPPPPPPDLLDGPRIEVGYRLTTYSSQVPVQHGVFVGGVWVFELGLLCGLELGMYRPSRSEADFVTLQIQRTSIGARAGWRWPLDPFALEVMAGYDGEVLERTVLATEAGIDGGAPETRWQSAIGGAVRGEVALTRSLGVFAGVGIFDVLNNFESIAIVDGEPRAVSTPHALRFSARAGFLLWP